MGEKDGEYNKWWYEAEENFIKITFKKDKKDIWLQKPSNISIYENCEES